MYKHIDISGSHEWVTCMTLLVTTPTCNTRVSHRHKKGTTYMQYEHKLFGSWSCRQSSRPHTGTSNLLVQRVLQLAGAKSRCSPLGQSVLQKKKKMNIPCLSQNFTTFVWTDFASVRQYQAHSHGGTLREPSFPPNLPSVLIFPPWVLIFFWFVVVAARAIHPLPRATTTPHCPATTCLAAHHVHAIQVRCALCGRESVQASWQRQRMVHKGPPFLTLPFSACNTKTPPK